MKRATWIVTGLALIVAAGIPAVAQSRKEVQGYLAGGYVLPEGKVSDYLNGGWNLSGGAILRPAPEHPFGIRFDLGYSSMGASSSTINAANSAGALRVDTGYMSMGNLTADALWEFGNPEHIGGYLGLGVGGYRRYATLQAYVPAGYCGYWGCYTYTGVQNIVDDSLTKFGYNASLGMTFAVGTGQMYVEARYHYMISSPSTQYIPILIGYRF
jgi:opacity protein-like surface antigen